MSTGLPHGQPGLRWLNDKLLHLTASRQLGHRLTVAWLTLALWAISVWEPTSLRHVILQEAGAIGDALSWLLVAGAIGGILDVAGNDLRRIPTLPFLQRHRVAAYALQAAVNVAIVWAMARAGQWSWIAAPYVVLACASLWIATFAALHERTGREG